MRNDRATSRDARASGWPRTNIRASRCSCSTHSGPIVSVSQPGTVHFVTIAMGAPFPRFETSASRVNVVRVLSVTHGANVPGGVFDEAVQASGHVLERWSVPDGGPPEPVRSYDAVMVFGGSMHPDEDERFAWLEREEEFLQDVLAESVPVLGICLGAQMLARAAGARVAPASAAEIGWLDVSLTPAGGDDPVLGVLPPSATVFQWHHYTFDLPPGAVELARSPICPQAFRLDGPAWGIQFHAEVTLAMLTAWSEEDPDDLPMPAEELRSESERLIARSNAQGRALADAFLTAASG
jgi:GMP synthase (glutamine-hydrolysing)